MKDIVWTRIDDRLIHGQVMTQWIQHCGANEVVIVDDGVAKDTFIQMVMKWYLTVGFICIFSVV